ncbi:MAG: sulfur carrier protein ThiS [Actinomycetota bacterium]|uniref:sulfur carrier protein ThiS n=1 Tax=Micrococcaceae TaxID=1268 RepID=UPI0024BBE2B3|nr:sulfur carrier protein ThiS [Paenarthrobacter sp. PH39-S1]MDJ0355583.1 sulfur carrier protein ThiS [Paenarthrobacter sp. PH39-S1]MDQ6738831.1 sulfur carrier protein ThiS [Actinomycetota bacterium]
MSIRLNGQNQQVETGQHVAALVSGVTGRAIDAFGQASDGARLGVAVAVNAAIVPRSRWNATELADNDDVEIVTAVQGG